MSGLNQVIGYCHETGYCISCGEVFSYNGIHPESECQTCKNIPKGQTTLGSRRRRSYCHNCGSSKFKRRKISHPGLVELRCAGCGEHRGVGREGFSTTIKAKFWKMKIEDINSSSTHTFIEYKEDKEFWNKRLENLIKLDKYPFPAVFLVGSDPQYLWIHKIEKVQTSKISTRYRKFIKTEQCWEITCSFSRKLEDSK